jgi:hypothetical protein
LILHIPQVDLEEPFGVIGLNDPHEFEVLDVIEVTRKQVYVQLRATFEAMVYAYVAKSEAYGIEEVSAFTVTDWDWNEHYAEVEATLDIEVLLGLTFDRENGDVLSIEVDGASNVTPENGSDLEHE